MSGFTVAGRRVAVPWPEVRRAIDGRIRRLLDWALLDPPAKLRWAYARWGGMRSAAEAAVSFRCEHCSRALRWRPPTGRSHTVCGSCMGNVLLPAEPMPAPRWQQWFAIDGDLVRGPVSAASLAAWIESGAVSRSAVVACAAGRQLTPLGEVEGDLRLWLERREMEARALSSEADRRLSGAHDGALARLLVRLWMPIWDPVALGNLGLDYGTTAAAIRWGHLYRVVGLWNAAAAAASALWLLIGLLWLVA